MERMRVLVPSQRALMVDPSGPATAAITNDLPTSPVDTISPEARRRAKCVPCDDQRTTNPSPSETINGLELKRGEGPMSRGDTKEAASRSPTSTQEIRLPEGWCRCSYSSYLATATSTLSLIL